MRCKARAMRVATFTQTKREFVTFIVYRPYRVTVNNILSKYFSSIERDKNITL